jgi:hypothetical protein
MNMKTSLITKVMCIGIVLSLALVGGCSKKKSTEPVQPTSYLMKDYFPLNIGDEWIWEHEQADSMAESFVDVSDSSLGEPFTDLNHDGIRQSNEPFEDLNLNGQYDSPYDPWTPGIPYFDKTNNGKYDSLNGIWDPGEPLTDLDSNGIWNWIFSTDTVRLKGEIIDTTYPGDNGIITRQSSYLDSSNELIIEDGYSSDSLGLRWHSHAEVHPTWFADELVTGDIIITITRPIILLNDSVINTDTTLFYYPQLVTWTNVLDGIENVTTPAGVFLNCLKFRTVATGWETTMIHYNGVSYQWYAKNVGLVKSEGPGEGEYWILKSAKINGNNYP